MMCCVVLICVVTGLSPVLAGLSPATTYHSRPRIQTTTRNIYRP
jgi:hypothetical protein